MSSRSSSQESDSADERAEFRSVAAAAAPETIGAGVDRIVHGLDFGIGFISALAVNHLLYADSPPGVIRSMRQLSAWRVFLLRDVRSPVILSGTPRGISECRAIL